MQNRKNELKGFMLKMNKKTITLINLRKVKKYLSVP